MNIWIKIFLILLIADIAYFSWPSETPPKQELQVEPIISQIKTETPVEAITASSTPIVEATPPAKYSNLKLLSGENTIMLQWCREGALQSNDRKTQQTDLTSNDREWITYDYIEEMKECDRLYNL